MTNKRPKIVLASVLKSVDEPRMFEKFAWALREKYEVHIIGYASDHELPAIESIHFHPIFDFADGKQRRVQASSVFLKRLHRIQPDLLVVHAVELLPAACWYALKQNIPLCYDVLENYWRNIIYQDNYSRLIKWPLAIGMRAVEWMSRSVVKHYFLAEQCYAQEFAFASGKFSILENKFRKLDGIERKVNQSERVHLVYTGTISAVYGAKEAFLFAKRLVNDGILLTLTMIGKVESHELGTWLAEQGTYYDWFDWKGEQEAVSHRMIIEMLAGADYALLPYQPNRSTQNCIPTKMYECLALGVPMIIQNNPLWENVCAPHDAAIFLDFPSNTTNEFKAKQANHAPYPNGRAQDACWRDELLQDVIAKLLT